MRNERCLIRNICLKNLKKNAICIILNFAEKSKLIDIHVYLEKKQLNVNFNKSKLNNIHILGVAK